MKLRKILNKVYLYFYLIPKIYLQEYIIIPIRQFYYHKILKLPYYDCPLSYWFELSYAQYLTIPRSVLEAMPYEWKKKFAKLLFELDNTIDWRPKEGRYWVQLKNSKGRYVNDPFMEYRHPVKLLFKNKK